MWSLIVESIARKQLYVLEQCMKYFQGCNPARRYAGLVPYRIKGTVESIAGCAMLCFATVSPFAGRSKLTQTQLLYLDPRDLVSPAVAEF